MRVHTDTRDTFSETKSSEKEYIYVAVRGLPLQCIALLFVIENVIFITSLLIVLTQGLQLNVKLQKVIVTSAPVVVERHRFATILKYRVYAVSYSLSRAA